MTTTQHIAQHLRQLYTGGNWTASNVKDALEGINWQQATQQIEGCNTIATLLFHINYYIHVIIPPLQGGTFEASDKLAFTHPPITSQNDWEAMKTRCFQETEALAQLIEKLPDTVLSQDFVDPKYGNYYRNLQGIIEHCHYHLGQIIILKKLLLAKK